MPREEEKTLTERLRQQTSPAQHPELQPLETRSAVRAGTPQRTPDGYTRQSPAQPLYVSRDYKKRRIKRLVLVGVALLFFILVLAAIARSGIISFK